jgi:hypothetical protein
VVNGTVVTAVVDGRNAFTHTFAPRVVDGFSHSLNTGLVGVGSDNARGSFDNVAVRVLPPNYTYDRTEDFTDGVAELFTGTRTGQWQISAGRYNAALGVGSDSAASLASLGATLEVSSVLELNTTVSTSARTGFVFDRYSDSDFKYVTLDAVNDKVIIGHYTKRSGWTIDASADRNIVEGRDYVLNVIIQSTTLSVTVDGQAAVGHAFNGILVDGEFGLLTVDGNGSFDKFTLRTNDPAFPLLAS